MDHLIPLEWFSGLTTWPLLLITLLSMGALIFGADKLVDGASGFAYRLGVPKIIVGATIVSLGTTSPECAVSVMAAWSGNSGLALGNAVGSIIADTALIFGIGCVITQLPADRFVLVRQGWVQAGSAVLLAALCYGMWYVHGEAAVITRAMGVLLLVLLVAYMVISVRWSRQHSSGEPFLAAEEMAREVPMTPATEIESKLTPPSLLIGIGLLGLAVVIVASHILIGAVSELARQWGVPQVVVASTIVAVGTSLPEMVVGMASIIKGHKELLIGNVIGADILNVLFVIGASATAVALPVVEQLPGGGTSSVFLYLHLPAMLAVLLLFRIFIAIAIRKGHFSRWMGYPLLAMYVGYVALQYTN